MENVTMTYEYFIDEVKTYISDLNELDMIKKAYDYAYQVHKGAKRLSGDDYIDHPLNTAFILTKIHSDYKTLCAALLHEVIKDGGVTEEELSKSFDAEIVSLVVGITKINR